MLAAAAFRPPGWAWAALVAGVVVMLAVDLTLHRHSGRVGTVEAAVWTILWIALALGFAGLLAVAADRHTASAFLTGYLLEKQLVIENVVAIELAFRSLAVPQPLRRRALVWSLVAALLLRLVFVVAGAALRPLDVLVPVLGAALVAFGLRVAFVSQGPHPSGESFLLRMLRSKGRVLDRFVGHALFVRRDGRRAITALGAALVTIAWADVIFAAGVVLVTTVVKGPFLVLAANSFAVLGMRGLFFLLDGIVKRPRPLRVGLAAVLAIGGLEMALRPFVRVPPSITNVLLLLAVGLSVATSVRPPDTASAPERRGRD